jgi:hypothetical protein
MLSVLVLTFFILHVRSCCKFAFISAVQCKWRELAIVILNHIGSDSQLITYAGDMDINHVHMQWTSIMLFLDLGAVATYTH